MPVLFANKVCLEPHLMYRECARMGIPMALWFGKANKFMCPAGPSPARAWLLMRRKDIDAIDKDALHKLIMNDGSTELIFHRLLFVKARRIMPGRLNDPDAPFLVEVADARWLADNPHYQNTIDKQFNVRSPIQAQTYYTHSMNSGIAWTWETMLENIWDGLGVPEFGEFPTLPGTVQGTPENYRFLVVSGWRAFNSILAQHGWTFVLDPLWDESARSFLFSIGQTNNNFNEATTQFANRLVFDAEFIEGRRAKMPFNIYVIFQKLRKHFGTERTTEYDATQWAGSPQHFISVNNPYGTTGLSGYTSVFDDMSAVVNLAGNLDNLTELTNRANRRRDDYYRALEVGGGFMNRVYRGLIGHYGFVPNSQVCGTAWYNVGEGFFTEICRMPPGVLQAGGDAEWNHSPVDVNEFLRPPDLARAGFPTYPHNVVQVRVTAKITGVDGFFVGKLVRINPEATLSPLTAPDESGQEVFLYAHGISTVGSNAVYGPHSIFPLVHNAVLHGWKTIPSAPTPTTRPLYYSVEGTSQFTTSVQQFTCDNGTIYQVLNISTFAGGHFIINTTTP